MFHIEILIHFAIAWSCDELQTVYSPHKAYYYYFKGSAALIGNSALAHKHYAISIHH